MKLPKLWRVKRGKKEIGALHVEIKGERINLRTKDPEEAKKRRARAMRGERNFASDTDGTASIIAVVEGTGDAETPPVVETPPVEPTPPVAGAADTGGVAPATADAEYKPPGDNWADAVNGTDSTSGDGAPGGAAQHADVGGFKISPYLLRKILRDAGLNVVKLQLHMQAMGVRYIAERDVGPVPADNIGVEEAAKLWGDWFVSLVPDNLIVPPWLAAPLLTALFALPVQLATSTPCAPSEKKENPEATPAPV